MAAIRFAHLQSAADAVKTPAMPDSASNVAEYSVSEISFALKRTIETAFDRVRIRGEISRVSRPRSGHIYFDLKDDRSVIAAIVWKSTAASLRHPPEQGLEVVATGRITTYPGQSKYQIVVEHLEPAGAGALMALLEERRKKLAAEGLFAGERKKPLPAMPRVIGVITSPSGAVIRDILHRLRDRFPTRVIVWPVRVQGDRAADEIAAAVTGFNSLHARGPVPRPELLIVARGGGSIEDLWAFNEEAPVRAVAESAIPVISAVGHETDVTLVDHAADLRAPTPTGAAELAVPVRAELDAALSDRAARLTLAVARFHERHRRDLRAAGRALPALADLLALPRQQLDHASGRLGRALMAAVERRRARFDTIGGRISPGLLSQTTRGLRERLQTTAARKRAAMGAAHRGHTWRIEQVAGRLSPELALRVIGGAGDQLANTVRLLDSVSYQAVIRRGFVLVRDAAGRPVRAAADVATGDRLSLQFADGAVEVLAQDAPGRRSVGTDRRKAKGGETGPQGDLF